MIRNISRHRFSLLHPSRKFTLQLLGNIESQHGSLRIPDRPTILQIKNTDSERKIL